MRKIVTVTFDFGEKTLYQTMHDVLLYSIEKHCPDIEWVSNILEEPELNGQVRGFVTNTVKLMRWVEELKVCREGDHVIFMDCDMLVIGDICSAFEEKFDIAFTYRTECKYPVNGGVKFVRVNKNSINFFEKFLEVNNMLLEKPEIHKRYRNIYAGMNQAAFGYMIENYPDIARLRGLPCSIWNVCDHYEDALNNGAKVLHIKGKLRRNIFNATELDIDDLQRATLIWNKYYEEWKEKDELKKAQKIC